MKISNSRLFALITLVFLSLLGCRTAKYDIVNKPGNKENPNNQNFNDDAKPTQFTFAVNPSTAYENEELTFTGQCNASNIQAIEWNFGDQSPVQTGSTIKHTYTTAGSYTVTGTCIEMNGKRTPSTLVIKVYDQSQNPNQTPGQVPGQTPSQNPGQL